jgi:hypothetical protein
MSWDRPFDQPVPLPNGRAARTLRDATNFIRKLPKSEHGSPEWRLAVQMLIDAAEDRGPMLFARIGILEATNRRKQKLARGASDLRRSWMEQRRSHKFQN